jgi:Cu(I)/Ag(I) efflux system membrane fusion protein/cobalt-zinc-cadmium efflux system membrane fusion protein
MAIGDIDMNTNKNTFPFKTVIFTAMITLIITLGAVYFFGYPALRGHAHPEGDQNLFKDANTQLYTCGMHPWIISEEPGDCPICGMKLTPKRDAEASDAEKGERKIVYWRDPDNPMGIHDKPGKNPGGKELIPVYEDEFISGVEVKIDPVTEQNMGLRTAVVEKGPLLHTIRTYGHITYDETRTGQINLKFSGWLEKLHVDFTGQLVQKNQPLFEIYSPELLTAQEEYLLAYRNLRRIGDERSKQMVASARRRLLYFDIAESEIREIETANSAKKTVTIRSPFSGVVTHKNAVEGGFVKDGTTIYTISDLSRVWVEAHIYEYELQRVSPGQDAEMTLPYLPGKIYSGKVAYVYPYLQQKTRDVVIRLEFENPDLELKPDMYADVRIKTTEEKDGLLIPSEAVIRSGERNVVFVASGEGRFTPREVTLGIALDGGKVQSLTGLAPGERIVTSGQFLLDSESKLKEAVQKMMEIKKGDIKKDKAAEDDFFSDMESEDDFFKDME